MRGISIAVGLVMSLGLIGSPARAENNDGPARAAARKLGYDGVAAFQAGELATASEKLEKAYVVLRVPSLGIWSARVLVKQGKLLEAADRYLEVSRLTLGSGDLEVQKRAQADAETELEATQQLTPNLTLKVNGAEPAAVSISVDGTHMASQLLGEAAPVNPGHHHIEGVWGGKHAVLDVTLAEREQKEATLDFASAAAPKAPPGAAAASNTANASPAPADTAASPAAPRSTVAWVVLGTGGAGLVVGGITGFLAMSKRNQLDKNPACKSDHVCPAELSSDVRSLNTLRTVSTVGLIAGGALAATGAVLLLTTPKTDAGTSATLWMSPTSVVLKGQF